MKVRMSRREALVTMLTTGAGLLMAGCFGIPKGTMKEVEVGETDLESKGAGIIGADAQKTVFKIKCRRCGYEADEMTIDTPTAGNAYTLDWVCPNCGHNQKIVIAAEHDSD